MSDSTTDRLIDAARRQAAGVQGGSSANAALPTTASAVGRVGADAGDGHGSPSVRAFGGPGADATGAAEHRKGIPERIGPYRILHEIGRGGMGRVYLAVRDDDQFRKQVAIKVLSRMAAEDSAFVERFKNERNILNALTHPNIARLLDGGETPDGLPYIAMEYVAGQSLIEHCDAQRLPLRDRLCLFQKVCEAVHYAHCNLVVHRDLKPSNIMVGADCEPKLLDFGIAKLLNPNLMAGLVMTRPLLRLLTPEYAAPEQVRGQPISTVTDVYSLGVLLYELICGERPYSFREAVEHEIVRVVCEVEPPPPSTRFQRFPTVAKDQPVPRLSTAEIAKLREASPERLRRDVRGDLDGIVLKALDKVPRRRYGSAQQLAEDLQRYLDGEPIIARPHSWVYRASKALRRHRVAFGATAAVFAALAIGTVTTWWQWRIATANAADARSQRQQVEKVYETAMKTLDYLLDTVNKELRRQEGASAARRVLLSTAGKIVDAPGFRELDDPVLGRGVRSLRGRVLVNLGQQQAGERGDEAQVQLGLANIRAGIAELEQAAASAADDELLMDLAEAWCILARAQVREPSQSVEAPAGALDKALQACEQSEQVASRIQNSGASREISARLKLLPALLLSVRGNVALARNELHVADEYFRESLTIREAIHTARQDDPKAKLDLAEGFMRCGRLAHARYSASVSSDSDRFRRQAVDHYEKAAELRRQVLERDDTNPRARHDLAAALEALHSVAAGPAAFEAGCEALTLFIRSVRLDGSSPATRADVDRCAAAVADAAIHILEHADEIGSIAPVCEGGLMVLRDALQVLDQPEKLRAQVQKADALCRQKSPRS